MQTRVTFLLAQFKMTKKIFVVTGEISGDKLAARVISKKYNSGNFFAAFKQKASEFNEHSIVLFETERGKRFKIKQIAGLVARRIINYMEPNHLVNRGQRLGFIRFGSRVEIFVPQDFQIDINVGDIVIGNYTILGRFL